MNVTKRGQITLPKAIRERFGFDGDHVYLERVERRADRGQDLVHTMRGAATVRMTTDEIMASTGG